MQSEEIINRYRKAREAFWGAKPTVSVVRLPEPAPPPPPPPPRPKINRIEVLQQVRTELVKMRPEPREIIGGVCRRWNITPEDLLAGPKSREMTLARIDAVNEMTAAGYRVQYIARLLNRDRTSILHLQKKYAPGSPHLDVLRTAHETATKRSRRFRR